MIVLVAIYLVLEFIISYKSTFHFFNKIRIVLPISISIITLWVVYPTIVRHSIFESISPVWFILSLANGIIIGNFINSIVYGLLVIRSKQESIQKGLPIVPISVKIVITLNSFLILIFLFLFFTQLHFTPSAITLIEYVIFFVSLLLTICISVLKNLFFYVNIDGKKVSIKERIEKWKETFDFHDYAYKTNNIGKQMIDLQELKDISPENLQKRLSTEISNNIIVNDLYSALFAGDNFKLIEYIKTNIDINEIKENGWTALIASCAQGHIETTRILLEHGANPDICNFNKVSPLNYSSRYGNLEICKLLVDFGAKIDVQDIYGSTALMNAVTSGNFDLIKFLIESGANTDIKDRNNFNAIDLAHKMKYGNIAKYLRNIKKL